MFSEVVFDVGSNFKHLLCYSGSMCGGILTVAAFFYNHGEVGYLSSYEHVVVMETLRSHI